jgi:antirestriction protein ArdC
MNTEKTDIYERVTNRIVELIERGADYKRPWTSVAATGLPVNFASKKAYRGINTLVLWAEASEKGYSSNTWGTYAQWSEVGAQVRKGEKSACVVFWKFWDVAGSGESQDGEESESTSRRCMARAYHVFNLAQVDNAPASIPQVPVPHFDAARIPELDSFVAATGAKVSNDGGARAFYRPATDSIHMPAFSLFPEAWGYYSTLTHELTHWTSHESRLNRKKELGRRFGDSNYAMEELIAELGSAYLCATLGLSPEEPREDHAGYLAGWLKVLKSDKRAIFTAASKAQAASDYLIETAKSNQEQAAIAA